MRKGYRSIVLTLALAMLFAMSACSAPMATAPQMTAAPQAAPYASEEEAGYGYETYAESNASADMAMPAPAEAPQAASAQDGGYNSGQAALAGRKIIRDASISIETDAFDQNLRHIEDKINSIGGYIENSYMRGNPPEEWEPTGRTLSMTVRVPQDSFEAFIKDVEGTGKVTELSRGSNDVTMQYIDNESRLSTLKIQLARLEDILTKSEKLADILTLESEIGRIRYEIESITTTQRRYDQLVQYATVNVNLFEVQEITYVQTPSEDLGTRINRAFVSVINALVTFFEWLLVFLIGAFPVLVLVGFILWLVFFIRRKLKKRKGAKAASAETGSAATKK